MQWGSPPLARGAPSSKSSSSCCFRITPARAGSTRLCGTARSSRRDHPRSRGEHTHLAGRLAHTDGSPPLARGALRVALRAVSRDGITPARAGSTPRSATIPRRRGDHPRSRGEHLPSLHCIARLAGSPPLARGALDERAARLRQERITPARAGSTRVACVSACLSADHPRSRGEHSAPPRSVKSRQGSPPLAQGARYGDGCGFVRCGITPARAGSTSRRQHHKLRTPDHPRSRGEHCTV